MTPEDIALRYDSNIVFSRWAATVVDTIVFIVAGVLLIFLPGEKFIATGIALWSVFVLLYYILLEGLTGSTLGKMLLGLKVVDDRGNPPGLVKETVRTIIRAFEVNPLLMGGIPAGIAVLASKKRQRIGDMAANTFVLRKSDLYLIGAPMQQSPYASQYVQAPTIPPPVYNPYGTQPNPPLAPAPYGAAQYPAAAPPYDVPQYPPPPGSLPYYPPAIPRRPLNLKWAFPSAIIATIIAAALIGGGASAYSAAKRNQKPTNITFEKFKQTLPTEGYFRITDCTLNLPEAVYITQRSRSSYSYSTSDSDEASDAGVFDIYVPLYASRDDLLNKTSVILLSDNPQDRRTVTDMKQLDDGTDKAAETWVKEHYDELVPSRDIVGTVQSDTDLLFSTQSEVEKLQKKMLTDKYVVIKEGDTPTPSGPTAAIGGGVLVGLLAGLFWLLALIGFAQKPRT